MANLTSVLRCVACDRADDGARGWRIYLVRDVPLRSATFCPDCAEREVGDDER